MKLGMYAVFDCKSEEFDHLRLYKRADEAIRGFTLSCNNVESDWFKYAEDYSMYHIADFDSEKGIVTPLTAPVHLIGAVQASNRHKDYYSLLSKDNTNSITSLNDVANMN